MSESRTPIEVDNDDKVQRKRITTAFKAIFLPSKPKTPEELAEQLKKDLLGTLIHCGMVDSDDIETFIDDIAEQYNFDITAVRASFETAWESTKKIVAGP